MHIQVMGFKGVPVLAVHPPFNIVKGVVADYLHCVLIGVAKSTMELWFNKTNRRKPFFIGNKVRMQLCVKYYEAEHFYID